MPYEQRTNWASSVGASRAAGKRSTIGPSGLTRGLGHHVAHAAISPISNVADFEPVAAHHNAKLTSAVNNQMIGEKEGLLAGRNLSDSQF